MTTLYHGNNKIIERPTTDMIHYACGFGQGFYLTPDEERAKEYAVSIGVDGYVSTYNIDLDKYSVLDLTGEDMSPLNWVGMLAKNRSIDAASIEALSAKRYLIDNYASTGVYDVVVGCRCDGVYTRVATDFINGRLSYRNLCRMINVGELQYAIINEEVLEDVQFVGAQFIQAVYEYPKKDVNYRKKLDGYNKRLNATPRSGDSYIGDIMKNGLNETV